jgi:hypothetical protein
MPTKPKTIKRRPNSKFGNKGYCRKYDYRDTVTNSTIAGLSGLIGTGIVGILIYYQLQKEKKNVYGTICEEIDNIVGNYTLQYYTNLLKLLAGHLKRNNTELLVDLFIASIKSKPIYDNPENLELPDMEDKETAGVMAILFSKISSKLAPAELDKAKKLLSTLQEKGEYFCKNYKPEEQNIKANLIAIKNGVVLGNMTRFQEVTDDENGMVAQAYRFLKGRMNKDDANTNLAKFGAKFGKGHTLSYGGGGWSTGGAYSQPSFGFGKKRNTRRKVVSKLTKSTKNKAKKLKISLTIQRNGKRVYKTEKMLIGQISRKNKRQSQKLK